MTTAICDTATTLGIELGDSTELVRGHDQWLLQRIMPLVYQQSLVLDLSAIKRIDAAGIAALITVYATACQEGHNFKVCNPSRQVAKILALVGLDRILLSQNAVRASHPGSNFERSAA